MFLYNCQKLTFYLTGAFDYNVSSPQLTEGRSARDQPKQPPAKKTATLFTPQQGEYVCWCNLLLRRKLCTTAGFLERWIMHTCSKFITSTSMQQNPSWKLLMKIQPQKHRPVFFKCVQIFQSCKVEWKSIKKLQIQWNCRNIPNMQEIHHPCKSPSHISCKTCSHRHSDIGKLQFTDIPIKKNHPQKDPTTIKVWKWFLISSFIAFTPKPSFWNVGLLFSVSSRPNIFDSWSWCYRNCVDMSPTGDLLVTSIFAGEVSSWAWGPSCVALAWHWVAAHMFSISF